jgi:endonuclease-3 related protein
LEKIATTKPDRIASLIKPSGYFNQKTKRLRTFCRHVLEKHGTVSGFLRQPKEKLRNELLEMNGIGPETADSIVLYAAQQPSFVVDAYTRRFAERYYGRKMDYAETQAFFEQQLPESTELFNEFHALLVEHAKRYCKTEAGCVKCSLRKDCKFSQRI